jgi:hypothetical protein
MSSIALRYQAMVDDTVAQASAQASGQEIGVGVA